MKIVVAAYILNGLKTRNRIAAFAMNVINILGGVKPIGTQKTGLE